MLDGRTALIETRSLDLRAGGTIGSAINRVNVDIIQKPAAGTALTAVAGGSLWLDLEGHLRDPSITGSSHRFDLDLLQAGGSLNLRLQSAVREDDGGGQSGKVRVLTAADAANAGDAADDLYQARFRPDDTSAPTPTSSMGFYAGTATALDGTYSFGTAAAAGLKVTGNGAINIAAAAPADGAAGQLVGVAGVSDLAGTGTLNVLTSGLVDLTEATGDLRIGSVRANFGNVALTAAAGSLLDSASGGADDGSVAWVIGNGVSLTALGGTVGLLGDLLEIDSSQQADGLVDALASGSVFLRETAGALRVGGMVARGGDLLLVTRSGAIVDGADDEAADLQASRIDLVTVGGGVGEAGHALDVYGAGSSQQAFPGQLDPSPPAAGRLVVDAAGAVTLRGVGGGLNLLSVNTTAGDITLSTADSANLGEDLVLAAGGGTTLQGAAVAFARVQGPGAVALQAGDDVTTAAGTLVAGGTSVLLQVDAQVADGDPGTGATAFIAGDLQAPAVDVAGGAQLDHLEIANAAGVNAGGSLRMRGGAGDDRFYLRATRGATTLQGDAGADRYYAAANAGKGLFTTGGVFDDTTDPLGRLSGLIGSYAGLSVDAGAGGAGGTVDALYLTADAAATAVTGSIGGSDAGGTTVGSVTGFGLSSAITYTATTGMGVFVELSNLADTLSVDAVASTVVLEIDGADGDDTLNVGQAGNSVAGIDGILSFVGKAGTDTLNVFGDASAEAGQLSAISLTGMGMGRNALVATHNGYGAGYDLTDADWTGAVYYGQRIDVAGTESVTSSVEQVNVQLGSGNDRFFIDGTHADTVTRVRGGDGDDRLVVGSTATGLHPNRLNRVDFVAGALHLDGQAGNDTIVLDDSGDDNRNTGTYLGNTITGLDMAGAVTFDAPDDNVDLRLGAGGVTFYVPAVAAGVTLNLATGSGIDRLVVGARAGEEAQGSLDAIQGTLLIDGQGPEAQDELVLTDRGQTAGRTIVVANAVDAATTTLDGGLVWRFDTTTVTTSGMGIGRIAYRRMEQVVLDAGQGHDQIRLEGTHREQSPIGKNSTFTVNAGGGDDVIEVGRPVAGGHTLAGFFIDSAPPTADSVRGIPVMVNGGAGTDEVHFLDTATTVATNLAFVNKTFDQIFPATAPATGADAYWLDLYGRLFGDDPTAVTYGTVVLNKAGAADPINVNSRGAEHLMVSLGSGDDVTQFFDGVYGYDMTVYAGDGDDTFNIDRGVDNRGHVAVLNGEAGDDLAFARFEGGVPAGTAFFQFNGGTHGTAGGANGNGGDTLRVAGDGRASGTYTPDAVTARAGQVVVGGNRFDFSGVEPLVVHGLADFDVAMPDGAAELTVDSIAVSDLNLTNLVLHTLTVDGVVTWTRQTSLVQPQAFETKFAGQAVASTATTLVVGAARENQPSGVVTVYGWNATTSAWVEQAKLYAPDLLQGGGAGFGGAVAIDGDTLVVGAKADNAGGNQSGAAYVFVRNNGAWSFQAKLRASDAQLLRQFGASVAVRGDHIVVGATGTLRDSVYAYRRSGSTWAQIQILTPGNGDDFGTALALSGTGMVVGAPLDSTAGLGRGAAFFYTFNGASWVRQATLLASETQQNEGFGRAVAIDGGRIAVGAPLWDDGTLADKGRVFVFDGAGSTWARVARLSADAGLTQAEATAERQAGMQFGAALAVGGDLVAVGAPLADNGTSLDVGAAYMFEYASGTTDNGQRSWVRATGTGSPRLQAATPAPASAGTGLYTTADRFGTAVSLAGGRLVVGMPGYNETSGTTLLRPDVGGVRSFSVSGSAPDFTNENLRAERLLNPAPSAGARFGEVTYYDTANRLLMVADTNNRTLRTYVNEGLSWRLASTITSNLVGFGSAIDVDNGRMVVGAAASDAVVVYELDAAREGWVEKQRLSGEGTSRFGTSVSISGNRLAVGMPEARSSYASVGQPDSNHRIDLGRTGGAVTYLYNTTTGVWGVDRVLMADDAALPTVTSETITFVPAGWNQVSIDGWGTFGIGAYGGYNGGRGNGTKVTLAPYMFFAATDTDSDLLFADRNSYRYTNNTNQFVDVFLPDNMADDVDVFIVGTVQNLSGVYVQVDTNGVRSTYLPTYWDYNQQNGTTYVLGPRTVWMGVDWVLDTLGPAGSEDEDTGYAAAANTGSTAFTYVNGIPNGLDIDDFYLASTREVTSTRIDRYQFNGLNAAGFGASVDIKGTEVYVGAPGKSRVALYDLTAASTTSWTATVGSFTNINPLRSKQLLSDVPATQGAAVLLRTDTRLLVGDPADNGVLQYVRDNTSSPWRYSGYIQVAPGAGQANTVAATTGRLLFGAPTGSGSVTTGSTVLRPSVLSGNAMADDTAVVGLGSGVQVISQGHYIAGTANGNAQPNDIYNFRQRGAGWAAAAADVVPTAIATAKAGVSVAIDGDTAVVGARDFDNRGAVFVYNANAAGNWTYSTMLQSSDIATGDRFGAAVAVSGNALIVGAPDKDGSGSVYLYQRVGDSWTQVTVADGRTGGRLGAAVDVYGSVAVAGQAGGSSGDVRVFSFNGATWTLRQTLTDLPISTSFGSAVALHQSTLVVGSPTSNSGLGAAGVYVLNGSNLFARQALLLPSALGVAGDRFGAAVDVWGDLVAVGAPNALGTRGAVYSYQRTGTSWGNEQRFSLGATGAVGDFFGAAVALEQGNLVVGAYGRKVGANEDQGAAYAWRLKNGAWLLETPIDPLSASDGFAGDQLGYSVALSGSRAMVGAPQLGGRPGAAIDTDGSGYAFIRDVSPPLTVTVVEEQAELIAGARANILAGSVGGVQTADLKFFDIANLSLTTGSQADQITVGAGGITAFGLQNFDLNTGGGDDRLDVLSAKLTPPAVGTFVPTGDLGSAPDGSPLPGGIVYVERTGAFRYDGGTGINALNATADTDWTLDTGLLSATGGGELALAQVRDVRLTGGAGINRLRVLNWAGQVVLDGGQGSDEFEVDAAAFDAVSLADAGGALDQLSLSGTAAADSVVISAGGVLFGSRLLDYAGMEAIAVAGGAGNDTLTVSDSTALRVRLDGETGSDTYRVFAGTTSPEVVVHDGGPLPAGGQNIDKLEVPANAVAGSSSYTVGGKLVRYDLSIEEFGASTVSPVLTLDGSVGVDVVTIGPEHAHDQRHDHRSQHRAGADAEPGCRQRRGHHQRLARHADQAGGQRRAGRRRPAERGPVHGHHLDLRRRRQRHRLRRPGAAFHRRRQPGHLGQPGGADLPARRQRRPGRQPAGRQRHRHPELCRPHQRCVGRPRVGRGHRHRRRHHRHRRAGWRQRHRHPDGCRHGQPVDAVRRQCRQRERHVQLQRHREPGGR